MLTVTGAAADAINQLTAQVGGSEESGLRVVSAVESPDRLDLSVASAPAAGDRVVVAAGGAQVFLDPRATELLSGKVLDVREGTGGRLDFTVSDPG